MPKTAFFTAGGGFIAVHLLKGQILSPAKETLVRLTITGLDGKTTYTYLTPKGVADLRSALLEIAYGES